MYFINFLRSKSSIRCYIICTLNLNITNAINFDLRFMLHWPKFDLYSFVRRSILKVAQVQFSRKSR